MNIDYRPKGVTLMEYFATRTWFKQKKKKARIYPREKAPRSQEVYSSHTMIALQLKFDEADKDYTYHSTPDNVIALKRAYIDLINARTRRSNHPQTRHLPKGVGL